VVGQKRKKQQVAKGGIVKESSNGCEEESRHKELDGPTRNGGVSYTNSTFKRRGTRERTKVFKRQCKRERKPNEKKVRGGSNGSIHKKDRKWGDTECGIKRLGIDKSKILEKA